MNSDARAFERFLPLAWGLVVLTFCLIVLGAVTRLMNAGLSCPDWPLCHGQLIPPFEGGVFFEWLHRLVAASVSAWLLVQLAWIALVTPLRRALWQPAMLAVALLATQIVLGALTVLKLLNAGTVTSHLATGTLLFAVLLSIAVKSLREARGLRLAQPSPPGLPLLALVVLIAVYLQILLGGAVAAHYASWACPDWPTCLGQWFPSMVGLVGLHMAHRWGAYGVVLLLAALMFASRAHPAPSIERFATVAFGLGLAQAVLGVANVLLKIPVPVSAAHNGLAVLLFATLVGLNAWLASAPAAAWRANEAVAS